MGRYMSDIEKNKVIELHNKNYNTNEIAKMLGRNQTTIERYLKKNGYGMNYGHSLTKSEKDFIIKSYTNDETCYEIWQKNFTDRYNSSAMVERIIRKNGLSRGRYKKEVIVNHNYFQNINNEHNAYWLGFLTADGEIRNKKGNSWLIKLELKNTDREMLEIFKKDIGSDVRIKDYKYDKKHNAMIHIYSKKWADDLSKFDVVPNKTFIINKLPNIPIELMKHFIRGYFDGDGSAMLYKPNDQRLKRLKVSICGTKDFLSHLNDFLCNHIGTKIQNLVNMNKYGSNVYNLRYTSNGDVLKFFEYIYSDYIVCLDRKRDKYLKFKSERNI